MARYQTQPHKRLEELLAVGNSRAEGPKWSCSSEVRRTDLVWTDGQLSRWMVSRFRWVSR